MSGNIMVMTARFISEDSYTGQKNDPLSLNLYTYCQNNPIMYIDPTGHAAGSVVDYLKSQGEASSYVARKELAKELGIKNYKGTATQNTQMLNTLKKQEAAKVETEKRETAKKAAFVPSVVTEEIRKANSTTTDSKTAVTPTAAPKSTNNVISSTVPSATYNNNNISQASVGGSVVRIPIIEGIKETAEIIGGKVSNVIQKALPVIKAFNVVTLTVDIWLAIPAETVNANEDELLQKYKEAENSKNDDKTYGDGVYPKDPSELVEQGWEDVTDSRDKSGNKTYEDPKTGEKVRYDGEEDGEGHYHRYNPNSTGRNDRYLDQNGNPVRDGSKPSHIYPK